MKKILLALSLLSIAGSSMAQYYHGHGLRHHGHHNSPRIIYRDNWVAPAIGAIVIGAALNEVYHRNQQTQVVIQNSVPPGQMCTPWTETQSSDGTITRTRTCQ